VAVPEHAYDILPFETRFAAMASDYSVAGVGFNALRMLTRQQITDLYRRRAKNYDLTVQLYNLLGFRIGSYRQEAIDSLHLKSGDIVVDIACGTGANFSMLREKVGQNGKIIGVDFTDAMLAEARERVKKRQWCNVELVQSDVASYQFPARVDAVISTFAIIYVPEFDDVIRKGSRALVAGGRLVVLDFKLPDGWISRLAPFAVVDTRPWGLTKEMASRHPWESIAKYMKPMPMMQRYGGFVFIAAGEQEGNALTFS
jgi:demethylmenaquinone methyltransferase/2-methoxy-6-polyprenyl-1,4-benzoquinol methylase